MWEPNRGHRHEWKPLLKGYPQLICKCGALRAKHVKVGKNTITMSPLGSSDNLMRFTTSGMTLAAAGDMSVDTASGRPVGFIANTRSLGLIEQPDQNRQWTWSADTGGTTIQNDGVLTTMSPGGTASVLRTNTGTFINYNRVGAGDYGIQTGTTIATSVTQTQYSPFMAAVIRTGSSVANTRFWICLAGSNVMLTASPSSTIGFRYDTSAGDSTWVAFTSGIASFNPQSTGVTVSPNTTYFLLFRCLTARADFWASAAGSTPSLVTSTSDFPTTVTTLNCFARGRPLVAGGDLAIGKISIMEGRRIA